MRLELEAFTLNPRVLVSGSRGAVPARQGVRLRLPNPGGRAGEGEATPMPEHGTEPLDAALQSLQAFRVDALPDSLEQLEAMLTPLDPTPAARHGVEVALLDLLARRRGIPLAQLLAGEGYRRSIEVNAIVDGVDAAALVRRSVEAVAAGFHTLKIKVGARPLSVDAQRLLAVRQAVGPAIKVRIDANGGWSEGAARSALRGMASLGLELCEQPVRATDTEGLRRLRGVGCLVAADEALLELGGEPLVLDPLKGAAADVVVLKPMALGGLLRSLRLARVAQAQGIGAYVTTMFDGPVARAAAAHLAAALPQDRWAHGLSTVELFEGARDDAFTPVQGRIVIPQSSGLGL